MKNTMTYAVALSTAIETVKDTMPEVAERLTALRETLAKRSQRSEDSKAKASAKRKEQNAAKRAEMCAQVVPILRDVMTADMTALGNELLERERDRCDELCDLIPKAHVVCGDATHTDVLREDGILSADGFVALTGDDGDNIITSLYARRCKVSKIVTQLNRRHFAEVLNDAGLDSVVSPKDLLAQQLARYVRAFGNSADSSVETLYRLGDGKVEALEFRVHEGARCTQAPIRDLRLRSNVLIAALIRGNRSIVPDGDTRILPGDHAVIVTAAGRLQQLDGILEIRP